MLEQTPSNLAYHLVYRRGAQQHRKPRFVNVAHLVAEGKWDTLVLGTVQQMIDWVDPLLEFVGSVDMKLDEKEDWKNWRKKEMADVACEFFSTAPRRDYIAFCWFWRCYVPLRQQHAFSRAKVLLQEQKKEVDIVSSKEAADGFCRLGIAGRSKLYLPPTLIDPALREYTEVVRFEIQGALEAISPVPAHLMPEGAIPGSPVVQKILQYATEGMRESIAQGDTEDQAVDERYFPERTISGVRCIENYVIRLGYLAPFYYSPQEARINQTWDNCDMRELFFSCRAGDACPMRSGISESDFNSYVAEHPMLWEGLRQWG